MLTCQRIACGGRAACRHDRLAYLIAWVLLWFCSGLCANPHGRLPERLTARPDGPGASSRSWTIKDIAELSVITDVKISENGREVAFVVKRSFVDSGQTSYGLYVVRSDGSGDARKLAESGYIADLAVHPHVGRWTVRADFGSGVQLFDISSDGTRSELFSIRDAVTVNCRNASPMSGPSRLRLQGVQSFEWAPDGTALWYSRLKLRSPAERKAYADQGVVYDDRTMSGSSARDRAGLLDKVELHVVRLVDRSDRVVAQADVIGSLNFTTFNRKWREALWEPNSRHIRYSVRSVGTDGEWENTLYRVDVVTGVSYRIVNSVLDRAVAMKDGQRFLAVSPAGKDAHLIAVDSSGAITKDYGAVPFLGIANDAGPGVWEVGANAEAVLAVHYSDRDGLVRLRQGRYAGEVVSTKDSLTRCSVNRRVQYAACVRESLTTPPEVVAVSIRNPQLKTIARPNGRYRRIPPLRTEYAQWVNRYGHRNDGYITYPRHFVRGRRYPVIVVTHGTDARNEFADQSFQWEFPIQVLSELDYFVLSVNEVRESAKVRALMQGRLEHTAKRGVSQVQFDLGLDAVASMEAALQALIDRGMADPSKTGIAGYSRGGEVVEYVMTQSKMFKVASVGDGGTTADMYWASGTQTMHQWQRALYGGPPYDPDPAVLENYERFSPSFRAARFAGPLLQQYTAATLPGAFELNRLLKDQRIPVELVFFPEESHIFWNPRHRVAAMQRNIEWFNFWLLDKRNPEKTEQYNRWSAFSKPSGDE